ncbi:Hypothetical predicted protein [Marmota monax]|uniref:Uncharacterized protein n=1 Tax=Marmota monax TaxID=9995 RepID=A0A5E4AI92_MARMO|nr:hypothetical protein GHT09_018768 [Marmota monax]VTJ56690.1 Hypothetical predicted protein [Marmota monax]
MSQPGSDLDNSRESAGTAASPETDWQLGNPRLPQCPGGWHLCHQAVAALLGTTSGVRGTPGQDLISSHRSCQCSPVAEDHRRAGSQPSGQAFPCELPRRQGLRCPGYTVSLQNPQDGTVPFRSQGRSSSLSSQLGTVEEEVGWALVSVLTSPSCLRSERPPKANCAA